MWIDSLYKFSEKNSFQKKWAIYDKKLILAM
jgi:hypothetical protein